MPAARVQVDLVATRRRRARLQRYVLSDLLDERHRFVCEHQAACRASVRASDAFREATMTHLGRRYDLLLDGKALRVVVVGQESGLPAAGAGVGVGRRVSLAERYAQIYDDAGLSRSYYATPLRRGRNPHMRGTTSVLRILFGKDLGSAHQQEYVRPVSGRPFHLFDGFALVNRLLCSAGPAGGSQGRSTPTMRANCLDHFAVTLRILDPTIVVLQGSAVRLWARELLTPDRTYTDTLFSTQLHARRVLVCAFSHPSARGPHRWGDDLSSPYLTDVVYPTLRSALRRL